VTDTNAIIGRLGALFVESLHIEAPAADIDLFETGILDSLQLVELLLQLEQRFGFQIKIDDIDLDDLRTLARIARLVAARTAGAGSQTTRLSSLEIRHGVVEQEANQPEFEPTGAEPRAGRAETNRASTSGSPRDSVSAEPVLRSGSVR
jgi:D-alanine--poly(phosphoribitol) ligase subunit 2